MSKTIVFLSRTHICLDDISCDVPAGWVSFLPWYSNVFFPMWVELSIPVVSYNDDLVKIYLVVIKETSSVKIPSHGVKDSMDVKNVVGRVPS